MSTDEIKQNPRQREALKPPDGWSPVDEEDAAHCLYGVRREDGDGCVWLSTDGRYLHNLHDADERSAFGAQSAPTAAVLHVLGQAGAIPAQCAIPDGGFIGARDFEHTQTMAYPDPAQQELDATQTCWTAFQRLAPAAQVRVLDWLAAHITPEPESSAAPAESQNIVCEGEDASQLDPLELAGHTPDTAHEVVRAAGLAAVGYTLPDNGELVAENSAMTGESESTWCTVWRLQPASSEQRPTQLVLAVVVDSSDGYRITRAELATQLV